MKLIRKIPLIKGIKPFVSASLGQNENKFSFCSSLAEIKIRIAVKFLLILALATAVLGAIPSAEAESANLSVKVVYKVETHTFATSASFSESLSNPNSTSIDVSFPADALTAGNEIEMTVLSMAESAVTSSRSLPGGKLAADTFYEFSFTKTSDNSSVASFDKDITLTFHYTDSDISGIDESTLAAYRWTGSSWSALSGSVVDTTANTVTVSVQQFSFFGLLGAAPAPSPVCGDGSCNGSETCSTCSADCGSCSVSGGGGGGGGGGGAAAVSETAAIFKGKAYPSSDITLLKNAQVAATTKAGPDANFEIRLSGLSGGIYTFGVWAEDSKGLRSITHTFSISVSSGASTVVSGIFIAPTIDVDKSEVKRGEDITFFGQTLPNAKILITVSSEEDMFAEAVAAKDGVYVRQFDTTPLEFGSHSAKSKAVAPDTTISSFSNAVGFRVGTKTVAKEEPKILKGDLNGDNRVNLIDFSITAYWYKRPSPPAKVDLNGDGKVDLVDFSIMAYYWTG